jgi:D-beta-D-heptose 7-phosphate kinase/D-beta-D-heptose 1-phosphate adenosyltransferase
MNTDVVKLLDTFAGFNVVVIGEAMLDCYLVGVANRLCPEAPVPVVTVADRKQAPGGAANTAVNVHSLGAKVTFLSVIGNDWEGAILRQALEKLGVSTLGVLTQPGRRTLAKQRVMAAGTLLVRFDQGSTDAIAKKTEQVLINELTTCFADCDAVIVSDYGYGILTAGVIGAIAKLQHSFARVLVVDSKNLTAYRHIGVTAVKPNYKEVIQLLGIEALHATSLPNPDARANQIAVHQERLLDLTGAQIAAVTLDAEGAIVFELGRSAYRTSSERASPSRATGAGDTFVSALTLALAAKATTPVATDLASTAAAVVVGKEGTTFCSIGELREMLLMPSLPVAEKYVPDPSWLVSRVESYRASGRRIVFTNGCFDILHSGHVSYLSRAKALGDILIIAVNSDASVSRLKGPSRPINSLSDRIQVLSALGCVNHLVPFDDDTPSKLIQLVRPDVYVKGGDYTRETLPEAPLVEQLGGVVQILPFLENRSTSSIIDRICKAQLEEDAKRQQVN